MKRTISVEHTVSMGHRLPSYKGLCSSPHGHNLRVVVTLELEGNTFVDFKEVSQLLSSLLEPFDHAMVLQLNDPLLSVLNDMGFRVFPFPTEPTTEAMAAFVLQQFEDEMTNHVALDIARLVDVTVYETAKYFATARRR